MHVYRVFNTRFIRVSGMWASGTAHVHTRDSPCAQAGQLVCIRGAAHVHTRGSPRVHIGFPNCVRANCVAVPSVPRVRAHRLPRVCTHGTAQLLLLLLLLLLSVAVAAATAGSGSVPCAS